MEKGRIKERYKWRRVEWRRVKWRRVEWRRVEWSRVEWRYKKKTVKNVDKSILNVRRAEDELIKLIKMNFHHEIFKQWNLIRRR